jgi:hypothetical protein
VKKYAERSTLNMPIAWVTNDWVKILESEDYAQTKESELLRLHSKSEALKYF